VDQSSFPRCLGGTSLQLPKNCKPSMLPRYPYTLPIWINAHANTILSRTKPLIFLPTTLCVISFMSHSRVFIEPLTISKMFSDRLMKSSTKAPKGKSKFPWSLHIGSFRNLHLMTSPRRLRVTLMGCYDSDGNNYQKDTPHLKGSQEGSSLWKWRRFSSPN